MAARRGRVGVPYCPGPHKAPGACLPSPHPSPPRPPHHRLHTGPPPTPPPRQHTVRPFGPIHALCATQVKEWPNTPTILISSILVDLGSTYLHVPYLMAVKFSLASLHIIFEPVVILSCRPALAANLRKLGQNSNSVTPQP